MASKPVEVEAPIKTTTLLTCAIISILMAFFIAFQGPLWLTPLGCASSLGSPVMMTGAVFPGFPMMVLVIIMGLRQIPSMRRLLNTRNMAYLFVTLVSCTMTGGILGSNDLGYLVGRVVTPDTVTRYIPEYFSYPIEAGETITYATAGSWGILPYGAILPALMWRLLMFGIFGGITIAVANILRREWIAIERVPFPYTQIYHSGLVNIESMGTRELPTKKTFLISMAIGFVLGLPIGAPKLFPWFPDIYMYNVDSCGPGSHFIAPPGIPWHLGVNKHPSVYGLCLIVPVHTLFSILFYLLVMEIATFVSFSMGYYTGMPDLGFCGRNWCWPTPYVSEPLFFSVIAAGATLGLFVSSIIQQRRYLMSTLRAAFGTLDEKEEIERAEPTSYRTAWLMLIVCYVLFMVFFMASGFSPWLSFVVPLSGVVTWVVSAQIWGRVGFSFEPCYDLTPATIRIMAWPTLYNPEITSTDLAIVPLLSREHIGHYASAGFGSAFSASMLSYKMADLAGIDSRSVFKIVVVSLFPALFVFLLSRMALIPGLLGGTRAGYTAADFSGDILANFWNRPNEGPLGERALWLIIGFVFMIGGRMLYTRFMWIPDPLPSVVAWGWGVSLWGAWVPILLAWIIKTIVLKVGGSKMYEHMIVPFASGLILGGVLEVLTLSILSIILVPPPI